VIRSFKLELVLWFALLALLPLGVAFYGYDSLSQSSETRRADASLEGALRVAVVGYADRLDRAAIRAGQLAADPAVQRSLRRHDRHSLARLVAKVEGAEVTAPWLRVGSSSPPAAVRSVTVVDRGKVLGRVSVRVAIDGKLIDALGTAVAPDDRLIAVRSGRVVAGTARGSSFALAPGAPARVTLGGKDFRALVTKPFAEPRGLALAALTSQPAITAVARGTESRILVVILASLLLFAVATYLLGRSIVGTLRRLADAARAIADGRLGERVAVGGRDEFAQLGRAFNEMAGQLEQRLAELETERGRLRHATARFGEALVATHDSSQLLRVVVESAVEATEASGGLVIGPGGELVRAGDPDAPGERIAFPLRAGGSDFGSLVISSPSFDADQVETAAALATQAVVALENARLHSIVERQALVDSLTGLANRRSLEETLRAELVRAARVGDAVCLVLADLDNFKLVNDRYGHPFGDAVLQEFARVLTGAVRESDAAARWGGEEFALVLTSTDAVGGATLAERARDAIEGSPLRTPAGDEVVVTASFGVAAFPEVHELGELLAAADSALYAAKRDGRNRVVVAAESSPRSR
jgi:diguanylate cyclase (GGDEF)-like protein